MTADDIEENENDVSASESAEGASGDGGEDGDKKFNAKKIILIVVPLLILLGGIAGAYYSGLFGTHEVDCSAVTESDEAYASCAEQLAIEQGMAPGLFITIPDMIVNLNAGGRQPRFLKIKLKVELEDPKDQVNFETIMPRVVDQFQTYLRELRVDDLRGSSGMYRMKIELLSRVKAAAPHIAVRDVLFQEILIQ